MRHADGGQSAEVRFCIKYALSQVIPTTGVLLTRNTTGNQEYGQVEQKNAQTKGFSCRSGENDKEEIKTLSSEQ